MSSTYSDSKIRHRYRRSQNKIQTLRDCLKSIQNEDYCLSMLATPTTSNPAGHRIKRTSSPIVEKSFLQEIQTRNQVCKLPCQRRPLLVDKKKILGYLGFGHLVSQLNGNNFIDIGQCDGNCRSSQYSTITVSFWVICRTILNACRC